MAQELTFNISEDRRQLQGPVEAKNFNLKFGTDGSAITHGKPDQWVQGRIGDDQLKQVFVNITEGENNTPKDVAGMFLAFVGIIHDKDGRPHRVVDYKHSTTIDVEHGRFRFDFPDQAFTVAGEYQQAFFMLIKEGPGGGCVATMEFDMQVMANFVFTDLVPEDYITPFNDTVDQLLAACKKFKDDTAADEAKFKQELEDAYAKFQKDTNTQLNNFKDATDEDLANFKKANADDIAKFKQQYADAVQAKEDELQSKVDSYTDKLDTMLKDLNQQGIDTTTMLNDLRSQMAALQDKINSEHLFTEDEAKVFEKSIEDKIGNIDSFKASGTNLTDKTLNEFSARGENVTWHGVVGDGKTDNTQALQDLSKWVDQQGKKTILYFPPGKYLWNETVQFNTPVVLAGTEDSWLKYTGTDDGLVLGKDGITDDDYLPQRSYTVQKLCFTGGDNSQYLIRFNKHVTQCRVIDCQFHDAGGTNSDAYCIWFSSENWDGRVTGCQFDATRGAGSRQFVGMKPGNSRIVVAHNLVTSLTGLGTGVLLNDFNCQAIANKIEGFQTNIRLGSQATSSVIAFNYFEKNGSTKRSAAIELGDVDPNVSVYPVGIYIVGNYANLHNVPDKMYSYFVGPSNENVLITNLSLQNNYVNAGNWDSKKELDGYIVYENNLPNQMGNNSINNRYGVGIKDVIRTGTSDTNNIAQWSSSDSNYKLWNPISKDADVSDGVFVADNQEFFVNLMNEKWEPIIQVQLDKYRNLTLSNHDQNSAIVLFKDGQIAFGKSGAVTTYDFANPMKATTIGVSKQFDDADPGQIYEGKDGNLYYKNLSSKVYKLTN